MAKRKSADQLVADIDARRARILKTVGDLQSFAKPANVANRGLAKATSLFVDEEGKARPQRIARIIYGHSLHVMTTT